MMRHPQLEADDLIAGWVQAHPNDNHVIISTDGDFAQLIAPNVKQYNGIQNVTITHIQFYDSPSFVSFASFSSLSPLLRPHAQLPVL